MARKRPKEFIDLDNSWDSYGLDSEDLSAYLSDSESNDFEDDFEDSEVSFSSLCSFLNLPIPLYLVFLIVFPVFILVFYQVHSSGGIESIQFAAYQQVLKNVIYFIFHLIPFWIFNFNYT
jgi:hypothetical protein